MAEDDVAVVLGTGAGMWSSPRAAAVTAQALERCARTDGISLNPNTFVGRLHAVAVEAATAVVRREAAERQASTPVDDEIDIAEAARRLDRSTRQVRRLLLDGRLGPWRKERGTYRVAAAEVDAYRQHRRSHDTVAASVTNAAARRPSATRTSAAPRRRQP